MQKIVPFLWFDNNLEECLEILYFRFQGFGSNEHYL